jgi:hypothetical protein
MPHRFTPLETGFRAYHGQSRGTGTSFDDKGGMHYMEGDFMHSESRSGVELFMPYGMSYHPLKRDSGGQGGGGGEGGGGGGGGDGGAGGKGYGPEVPLNYPGGNRNHPMAMGASDRRHRPRKLQEGEVTQHDDQGQAVYHARKMTRVESPLDEGVIVQHYEKENDQQQGQQGEQGGQSGGGQSGSAQKKGRDMSKEVKPTSKVQAKKNEVVIDAKTKITLSIGGQAKITITKDGIWLIGKNYHGVDSDGETPSTKDETISDTPAKQVWNKV